MIFKRKTDGKREDNLGIEERLERASRRMAGIAACVFGVLALAALEPAAAHHQWIFKTIYQFCQEKKCHDGGAPTGPLLMDQHGDLYGATLAASARQKGMVFKLVQRNGSWNYRILHRFCTDDACADDCGPLGGMIMDIAGNLYGTTAGCALGRYTWGTVFKLSPSADGKTWSHSVLYRFGSYSGDGLAPPSGLTYAGAQAGEPYDGVSPLYGVTLGGGAFDPNGGAVYRLSFDSGSDTWQEKVLHSFCAQGRGTCTDGKEPEGKPVIDSDGNIFGTTFNGGSSANRGVAHELSPNGQGYWIETVLVTFCESCTSGGSPYAGLIMDPSGNLLGTTVAGGAADSGTVFKLTFAEGSWNETVLHSFDAAGDGALPYAELHRDVAGNLYGTTILGGAHGYGIVFKLGKSYHVLHSFCDCGDGKFALTGLAQDALGNVFGVNYGTGDEGDGGTAFELSP